MTDEEIERIEAGREMDALMAERVMLAEDGGSFWHETLACGYPDCPQCACNCPHYSTDIAAAWQVVEKMLTYWPDLHFQHHPARKWGVVGYYNMSTDDHKPSTWGETLALAICRAALKCCRNVADEKEDAVEAPSVVRLIAKRN